MTEFELKYLLAENGMGALEAIGMYMTVTTAYLVAAYLAGRRLTTSQIITISGLYVVAAILCTWATSAYITSGIEIADALEVLHPDRIYGMQPIARLFCVALQGLGILASLKFMWDIRRTPEN